MTIDDTGHQIAGRLRRAALRDILAVSPGVVPFGVTLGVTAVTIGNSATSALVGAVAVYGGSAQLTTITVMHLGTGLLAAVLSGAVVNARIMLYAAALQPMFRDQPLWFRLLAPQFILDQTYLSAVGRADLSPAEFRRYWAWLGGFLLAVWTASIAIGLVAAPVLPALPHLTLVAAALFIALLIPRVDDRTSCTVALTAAGVSLAVVRVIPELGIIGGTIAGVAVAMVADRGTAP